MLAAGGAVQPLCGLAARASARLSRRSAGAAAAAAAAPRRWCASAALRVGGAGSAGDAGACGLRDAGIPESSNVHGAPVMLPYYPEATAKERKRLINNAVASTPKGETPLIPPHGYLDEEHMMWEAIFRNVASTASKHACPEYLTALFDGVAYDERKVPDMERLIARVQQLAGWQVSPCVGSLCPRDFFIDLAARRMPCTMYIRPHTKYTFTEDPDCVHEMLGHIPHLFIPSWGRLYQEFGRTAGRLEERADAEAMERLILMYFAVVEKGLVRSGPGGETKAIGASVISGAGELAYCMSQPERHMPLNFDNVMKYGSTDEDGFMKSYFIGESVDEMANSLVSWMRTL